MKPIHLLSDIHLGESFAQIRTMNETYINSTYFKKGHYVEQLAAFTKVFRRDQILIFSSAGAFQSTANVMESIRQFIGVREHDSFYKSLPHGMFRNCDSLLNTIIDLNYLIDDLNHAYCSISYHR